MTLLKIEKIEVLHDIVKELKNSKKQYDRTSEKRFKMGISASRAQTTSINARLSTQAEHVDRQHLKLNTFIEDNFKNSSYRICQECKFHEDIGKSHKKCSQLDISTSFDFACNMFESRCL